MSKKTNLWELSNQNIRLLFTLVTEDDCCDVIKLFADILLNIFINIHFVKNKCNIRRNIIFRKFLTNLLRVYLLLNPIPPTHPPQSEQG